MAAPSTKPRSPFGDLLRDILEEKDVTIRGLARRLTASDEHTDIESRRRMLQRYIRGDVNPGGHIRDEIADALDVDRERFAEDREQEERRRRLAAAMEPLADELLRLATEIRETHA